MNRSNTYILQRNAMVFSVVLWLCVLIVSIGVQAVNHANNEKIAQQRTAEVTFWLVVSGKADGNAPTVENQLALDLRPVAGDDEAMVNFIGDANSYGGITDAIGYSPFYANNCDECGHLTTEFQRKLELVADGKVNKVIGEIDTDVDTEGYDLSFVGPMWFNVLVGYLVVGLAVFATARLLEGPNDPEDYPAVYLISPVGAFLTKVREHSHATASERKKRAAFPDYMDLIDRADRQLSQMADGPDKVTLQGQRNRIAAEVEEQMSKASRDRSDDELAALQVEMEVSTSFLEDQDAAEESL